LDFNLVTYGFIALSVGFFLAFLASAYALARIAKFEKSVSDLDWESLADLAIDVQKLKKNAQKYQANVNAAQKLTQKEKLQMAIEQAQYQQQQPVSNIIGMER
jgi:biopolymer transport protein ExbB/TolQ